MRVSERPPPEGVAVPHDTDAFNGFYASPLGLTARRLIRRQLRGLISSGSKQRVLAYGFAEPYRNAFPGSDAAFAQAPSGDWDAPLVLSPLAENRIDAPDGAFDRVILVHALEYAAAPNLLITEVRRVLADHGRLLVVVPNRHGLWAQAETTPFGHGMPYSTVQLRRLLHEEHFTLEDIRRALFAPPVNRELFHYCASGVECGISRVLPGLAGVLIGVARKNIYAPSGLVFASRVATAELSKGLFPLPA